MNKNIKVDILQKKITITKRFYRLSQDPRSYEFEELSQLQRQLPDYQIQLAETPRRNDKRQYPTYEDMLRFIRLSGGDEMEFAKATETARSFKVPYNYVRQWFFKNYPMYECKMYAA